MTLLKVIVLSRFLANDEIFKDYLTSFTVFLEILKKKKEKNALKKALKMTSQLVIFRAFFFRPLDPRSEKEIPVNQLIKKIWPNTQASSNRRVRVLRIWFRYTHNNASKYQAKN